MNKIFFNKISIVIVIVLVNSIVLQNIMSTSFLEKFKGKTQQMGKEGLIGVIDNNNG